MPVFTLVVDGDRRLCQRHFPYIRSRLNFLLASHLPDVRLLSNGKGASLFAEWWAQDHKLKVERFPPGPDCQSDACYWHWVMRQEPSGLVVFDGGEDQSAELVRKMVCADRPVRFVDMRAKGLEQVHPVFLKADRNW
jgi:hypothetical protein